VRARIAASAIDYNRSAEHWFLPKEDNSYYPTYDLMGNNLHKGIFVNANAKMYEPQESKGGFVREFGRTHVGTYPCTAATPLGQVLACRPQDTLCNKSSEEDDIVLSSSLTPPPRCDVVYVGHNLIGAELNWLSTEYLVNWWKTTEWWSQEQKQLQERQHADGSDSGSIVSSNNNSHMKSDDNDNVVALLRKRLEPIVGPMPIPRQLKDVYHVPPTLNCSFPNLEKLDNLDKKMVPYQKCHQAKEKVYDSLSRHVAFDSDHADPNSVAWAQMLASIPAMRVTVIRDPFSWLVSKFFWARTHRSRDGSLVSPGQSSKVGKLYRNEERTNETVTYVTCDDVEEAAYGWASVYAMTFLYYLCGEHCQGGMADGSMTIDDLEQQAAYNLRNSFAAIGILEKSEDEFFDMLKKRVHYMDTERNLHVHGSEHSSGKGKENQRCKEVFKDPHFREQLSKKAPAVAALDRLYKVALEVNEFQLQELEECSATSTTQ